MNTKRIIQDFETAKQHAEQGDAAAQFNLALMYNKGEGTLQDYKQAAYWYQKSVEQGVTKAQYNLATIYYDGDGTLQDKKQAAYWCKRAYENGLEKAKALWDEGGAMEVLRRKG